MLASPPSKHGLVSSTDARRAEARLLRAQGHPSRACAELIHAVREAPVTPPLAREMVAFARAASMEAVAAAALEEAWPQADPVHHLALHRVLARLWRKQGRLDQARLHLYQILADRPADARAQLALTRVLAREGRTQELEKTLARLERDAVHLGRLRNAARFATERGRLLGELLGNRVGAAEAFGLAAEHHRAVKKPEAALWARALAGAALSAVKADAALLEPAIAKLVEAAMAAHRERDAHHLAQSLRLGGSDPAPFLASMASVAERRREKLISVALWEAAIESDPGAVAWPAQLVRLFTGERAWFDLAQHYQRCAARPQVASASAMRATWLNHRAEIFETRLHDLPAAAQARGEAFAVGGDRAALRAQLGLLERLNGPQAPDIALDRSVATAAEPTIQAAALQVRAERQAKRKRFSEAVADLTRAHLLRPLDPDGMRLLGECRAEEGEAGAIAELWQAASALPRGSRDRAERFRKLAQLCLWPLGDAERSLQAWREVLADLPGDTEAEDKLLQAAQARNRPEELVPILRGRIARLVRGPDARQARHALAQVLERQGREDEAVRVWEEAVRAEPSDASAQLALADRLEERGRFDEAALALEGAAQALDDRSASGQVWLRLGRFYRERLRAPERAYAAEKRAVACGVLPPPVDRPRAGSPPPPPPSAPPRPVPTPRSVPREAAAPPPVLADASAPQTKEPTTASGNRTRRKRSRTETHKIPLAKAAPADLLAALERDPLLPATHRNLAHHFERKGDVLRASLFTEVRHALQGDPDAHPLAPRGTLTALELASVRHPQLKGPVVEALALIGDALCAQASRSRKAEPFNMAVGKGAPVAGQALLDVVRLLGQRAPDVVLANEEGPPFLLHNANPVRLAVGKIAVRKPLPDAELRFYAARALHSLHAELLALRLLDVDQLTAGLQRARDALLPDRLPLLAPAAVKALLAAVGPKKRERFAELAAAMDTEGVDLERLIALARYTANRAGLMAAGGVAPTLRALQSKKAGNDELAEVVRFAVSDRMVRIRLARK